jgi:hypothetical protein
MNRDEINNKYQQPLYSDSLSYVMFYGFIILIILNIIFIMGVILSNYESKPKSLYTNRFYNSSLDQESMSYTPSLKTIK